MENKMRKFERMIVGCTAYYKFEGTNKLGDSLQVELHEIDGNGNVAKYWQKEKLVKKMESYLIANTFVTDTKGNCFGIYNPTCIYGKNPRYGLIGSWVNFEWIVKTEDEIIAEIVRQFEEGGIREWENITR